MEEQVLTLTVGLPLALLLGLAIPGLVWLLYHRVTTGIVVVALLYLSEAWFHHFEGVRFGLNIFPHDAVFAVIALAGLLRLLFAADFPRRSALWLLFGMLLFASVAIGLPRFGTTAGVEFREYFYFWTGTLYFMSFPLDEKYWAAVIKCWKAIAVALVLLAFFRWVAEYLDWSIKEMWKQLMVGEHNGARVIHAGHAVFLVQAIVAWMLLPGRNSNLRNMVWIGLLLACVIVLQHRTAWLVALACIVVLVGFMPEVRRRVSLPLFAGGGLLVMVAVVLTAVGGLDSLGQAVQRSAVDATTLEYGAGTHGERIYGWSQLLGGLQPMEWITGKPFGSGWTRFESPFRRQMIEYFPHNLYVATVLRIGLIGVALLVLAYVTTMVGLWSVSRDSSTSFWRARFLFVLLLGHLIFYVSYQLAYEQCILLGIAMSMVAARKRVSTSETETLVAGNQKVTES